LWIAMLFLSAAEIAVLLLIVWYAWTWPRQEVAGDPGHPGAVA
jgi:hypothetical protein